MNDANQEPLVANSDVLNVLGDPVPPLSDAVLDKVIAGRESRTQILDGSDLPQHEGLVPYAVSHVDMKFDHEDDLVRCVRLLQWSDARMRAMTDPQILWNWNSSFRNDQEIEFSVSWFGEEFFENRKDSFMDGMHSGFYSVFGLTPEDIRVRHEVLAPES
jgi:hypothetical protein